MTRKVIGVDWTTHRVGRNQYIAEVCIAYSDCTVDVNVYDDNPTPEADALVRAEQEALKIAIDA